MQAVIKKEAQSYFQPKEKASQDTNGNSIYSHTYNYYFSGYCQEILQLSSLLTLQLVKNTDLITQYSLFRKKETQDGEKSVNSTQYHSNGSHKNASEINMNQNLDFERQEHKNVYRRRWQRNTDTSEQSYKPEDQHYDGSYCTVSQSKNIPKNYSKAIFNFISKQEKYISALLQRQNISQKQFAQSKQQLKNNINSIAQLRSLWINSQNRFAKIYRIITIQYLRKHSLGYIFNSRVNNFHKHIKYRHKIMQSVKHPETFTCMKEF